MKIFKFGFRSCYILLHISCPTSELYFVELSHHRLVHSECWAKRTTSNAIYCRVYDTELRLVNSDFGLDGN